MGANISYWFVEKPPFFASNLTPDATGIGSWTENQFLIAIKKRCL